MRRKANSLDIKSINFSSQKIYVRQTSYKLYPSKQIKTLAFKSKLHEYSHNERKHLKQLSFYTFTKTLLENVYFFQCLSSVKQVTSNTPVSR